MSKLLSLKIRDDIFLEVEKITKKKKIPRNAYINKALAFYNDLNKRKNLKEQLQYESNMVKTIPWKYWMNSKNLRMTLLKAQNSASGKFKNSNLEIIEISYATPELLRRHIDSRGRQTRHQNHKTILKKIPQLFQFD